ncbi:MAG: glutathione peroxidase [Acidimicrobiia bacterium]|nr:glutathione peroxidase [Acidimicrobiia bacterium]
MSVFDVEISHLDGRAGLLADLAGHAALFVNVASRCGLTPQYAGLQALHDRFQPRGFFVVGFPCNQFMGQEPGTPSEIAEFCATSYGVTFPLSEKIDVNGAERHPLYAQLIAGAPGGASDVEWNFEKFVITPEGTVAARFGPQTEPDDAALVAAVEAVLPI